MSLCHDVHLCSAFARFGVCVISMVVDGTVPIITSDVAVHPHGFVVIFHLYIMSNLGLTWIRLD